MASIKTKRIVSGLYSFGGFTIEKKFNKYEIAIGWDVFDNISDKMERFKTKRECICFIEIWLWLENKDSVINGGV